MNKALYNTILWFIILGLAVVAVLVFLLYKRTRMVTVQTKSDFEAIEEAFETHKKASREKYEKLVVSHHNEVMKLRRS